MLSKFRFGGSTLRRVGNGFLIASVLVLAQFMLLAGESAHHHDDPHGGAECGLCLALHNAGTGIAVPPFALFSSHMTVAIAFSPDIVLPAPQYYGAIPARSPPLY
ncbi:MAG: hypothetical protein HY751_02745 [Nitrospinae bacterium]|nr:hypothetical protein [Nitrospinota bacterium]